MSKWTEFIKDFARRHNLSYGCAMSDKRCSAEYKQYKIDELNISEKKKSKKVIPLKQKSKTPSEISKQWLDYMEIHNIPDFLENKKELKKLYKEELREIAEHFGLKVSKHDDKEKLANMIVNFATNYDESLLESTLEEQPILKEQKPKKVKPIIDIQNFPSELQSKFGRSLNNPYYNNKSLEDFLKDKKYLMNKFNKHLIEIANVFGIKVSKYDDKEKLANKILEYTTRIM
jgi:hypothetical protein